MPPPTQVWTLEELKAALSSNAEAIEVLDVQLAKRIVFLKRASKPVLCAVMALAGIGVAASFTPIAPVVVGAVGVTAMTGAELTTVTVVSLLALLGASLAWALINGYDVDLTGEIATPDGCKVKGGVKLRSKKAKGN